MSKEERTWWHGLRFLTLGVTILPLAVMLILSVGAASIALQVTLRSLAQNRNLDLVNLSADKLAQNLDRYTLALSVLAQQPTLYNFNQNEAPFVFEQYTYLITDFVQDGGLVLVDDTGQVQLTYPSQTNLLNQSYTAQPYFQQLQTLDPNQFIFFGVVNDPVNNQPMVGLAMPLYDATQTFKGVLIGQFYLNNHQFERFTYPLQRGETGMAYLVDVDGQAIFHPNADLVGQDLSGYPGVVQLLNNGEAGVYIAENQETPGELISYAPVGTTGWGLVMVEPWRHVIEPLQEPLQFITGALVLGVLGLSLVVLWVVHRITQRLNHLVVQTRQVSAGAYDIAVDLSRISEIRALGVAFNHMVSEISRYRSGLQEYVASVTSSQEEERKRIARDLHDGTIQSLIAIGQRIELARDALDERPIAESKEQLTELRAMLKDTIANVRQFSRDLRPLALEDLGLVPALHYLVTQLERENMSVQLHIEGNAIGLSQDLEITIYRIIQEALNNIRKHAQASEVFLIVRFLQRQTILEIQDNGLGFKVPKQTTDLAREGSFGLLGLEERASLFGGDISIESALNQGTIVRVVLPHKQIPHRRRVSGEIEDSFEVNH